MLHLAWRKLNKESAIADDDITVGESPGRERVSHPSVSSVA
jgi:hypothetical protein